MRHAVLYKLAQLRIALLVLERMRKHRDAARAAYCLDRHLYRDDRARQIVLLPFLDIALERVVHAVGKSQFIEHPRKVRPAYGFAEARSHLVIVKGQTVRRHELRHLAVSVVAVVYHPVQHRAQLRRLRVYEIAQNVYGHAVLRAYLYPRHDLYSELFPRLGGFKIAGFRVMIRYRNGLQADFLCKSNDLRRGACPVGRRSVYVQVYLSHARTFSMRRFAFSYISSGASPMKNSPFS